MQLCKSFSVERKERYENIGRPIVRQGRIVTKHLNWIWRSDNKPK